VVVGLVLDILRSLGGEVDRQEERAGDESEEGGDLDRGGAAAGTDIDQGEGPELAERPEHLDAELQTPLTAAESEEARR
jgi:multicomponent Na+:H+ antiporter subunit A